jgi:hypothetical protein
MVQHDKDCRNKLYIETNVIILFQFVQTIENVDDFIVRQLRDYHVTRAQVLRN